MSDFEGYTILIVGGSILLTLYVLPIIVALYRRHHYTAAIVVINLLLGWTLLGWVAALAISVTPVIERRRD